MKSFVARHPLVFSLLLTLVLFGLLFLSAAMPLPVISSVDDLPLEVLEQPSVWQQALTLVASAQNLF